jgi:hypothetical protein
MMYIIQLLVVLLVAISKASTRAVLQDQHQWRKPTAEDARSPCPALNVLANHGYL